MAIAFCTGPVFIYVVIPGSSVPPVVVPQTTARTPSASSTSANVSQNNVPPGALPPPPPPNPRQPTPSQAQASQPHFAPKPYPTPTPTPSSNPSPAPTDFFPGFTGAVPPPPPPNLFTPTVPGQPQPPTPDLLFGTPAGSVNAFTQQPVAASTGPQVVFLGTCEEIPRVVKRKTFVAVRSDVSCAVLPFDEIWAGEEGWIFATLTRWNEGVYRAIAAAPAPGLNEGMDVRSGRGTMMMLERAGYQLILRYPHYENHPIFSQNGMLAGERYLCGYLKGEDAHSPGLRANKRHLAFYAMNVYNWRTGEFYLFNHDMTGVPQYPSLATLSTAGAA